VIALAKDALDVGLFTEQLDASLAFWCDDVGLKYDEVLPIGGGVRQHRVVAGDTVIKVNHSRNPLPEAVTTLSRVVVAVPGADAAKSLTSPDGLPVDVVPAPSSKVTVGVVVRSPHADHVRGFWDRIGLARDVVVEPDESARYDGELRSLGFRFLTVQVRDVHAAHAELVAAGASQLSPPTRFGDVAVAAFVADPDGVAIEISQRASLVGGLPDR
jgi:catechol 2,3-dioxygenase-like lactoylglutathione lyase family enzyme